MDTILDIISDLTEGAVDKAFERAVEVAKRQTQREPQAAPHTQKNAAEESIKKSKKNKQAHKAAPAIPKACDNYSGDLHKHEKPSESYQWGGSQVHYTKLQEAIVMSEILGKPVSQKRRNRVGRM